MLFRDLKKYDELEEMHDDYYSKLCEYDFPIYLFHPFYYQELTLHDSLRDAYEFLRKHKDLEVYDDFFGGDFPFIRGQKIHDDHFNTGVFPKITIRGLRIFDNIVYEDLVGISDFQRKFSPYKKYLKFLKCNISNGLWMIEHRGLYFTTSNHSKLVDKIGIMKVMRL